MALKKLKILFPNSLIKMHLHRFEPSGELYIKFMDSKGHPLMGMRNIAIDASEKCLESDCDFRMKDVGAVCRAYEQIQLKKS